MDGGLTWSYWDPDNFEGDGLPATQPPSGGVDFAAPGFAFKVNSIYYPEDQADGFGRYDARSWFYSYDKGASWHGPFTFHGFPWDGPVFGDAHRSWGEFATSRTDYIVLHRVCWVGIFYPPFPFSPDAGTARRCTPVTNRAER